MRVILLTVLALSLLSCSSSGGNDSSGHPQRPDTNTSYPPVTDQNSSQETNETNETNETVSPPPSVDQNSSQEVNTTIVFRVNVPQVTPKNDFICFKFYDGKPPNKMKPDGADTWKIEINASDVTAAKYKYCRNCEPWGADEYLGPNGVGWRENSNLYDYHKGRLYEDSVSRWRWLDENLTSIDINNSSYLSIKPNMNKTGYMSGIVLNDWWQHRWLASVDETLQKASTDLDAKWVQIALVPQILNINDPSTLKVDPYGVNGMSDADLNATIEIAHTKGLKVFLNPSPWSFDEEQDRENHTQAWWDSYLKALEPVYTHYAEIAQAKGVEMFEVHAWTNIDSINAQQASKMEDNASALLAKVKAIYSGNIAVQSICYDTSKPILDIQKNADYLTMNIWQYYPWPFADSDDANVSVMRERLKSDLATCKKYYDDNNITKPIVIEQLAMASFNGAINHNDIEGIDSFHEDNRSYSLDLQEQADSFEAIFQAMADASWIDGDFVFTYFYWDSIGKDINVRGKKPVEKEIKKWHEWLNQ